MSTVMNSKTDVGNGLDVRVLARILEEGFGPGAWHGADLKAALDEVTPAMAFWRPAAERHSIAEIALHHAYCARAVRGQLSGAALEPFVLEGEDWFPLSDQTTLTWLEIRALVESEHLRLAAVVADIGAGRVSVSQTDAERLDLVLGITCHAIYHAGQVQLIKKLQSSS